MYYWDWFNTHNLIEKFNDAYIFNVLIYGRFKMDYLVVVLNFSPLTEAVCVLNLEVYRRRSFDGSTLTKPWLMTTYSEFLKAAIMQSHDCAKHLRICPSFRIVNAKKKRKMALISCIWHNFTKFPLVLHIFRSF